MLSDEQKKLVFWGRQSTYVGGPSVICSRKSSTNHTNKYNRARSADARCFGFGSGMGRFTIIQSSPASPVVDKSPLFGYYKDIDIEDGSGCGGGGSTHASRPHHVRKRSRHDCHFAPGTSIPLGKTCQWSWVHKEFSLPPSSLFSFSLLFEDWSTDYDYFTTLVCW